MCVYSVILSRAANTSSFLPKIYVLPLRKLQILFTILHPKKGKPIDEKNKNKQEKHRWRKKNIPFHSISFDKTREREHENKNWKEFISLHFDFPLNLNKIEMNELLNTIPMSIQWIFQRSQKRIKTLKRPKIRRRIGSILVNNYAFYVGIHTKCQWTS